jgi:hypothetical protein
MVQARTSLNKCAVGRTSSSFSELDRGGMALQKHRYFVKLSTLVAEIAGKKTPKVPAF